MLQEHDDRLRIIRARTILDMLGERPATGRDLFRPLKGLDNAALLVRGGRVLDVTALGATFAEARERAYEAAELISFDGKQMRMDIGLRALSGREAWEA